MLTSFSSSSVFFSLCLETLESSKKFQDFNFKQLLEEFSEINKKKNLFEITTQTNNHIVKFTKNHNIEYGEIVRIIENKGNIFFIISLFHEEAKFEFKKI